MTGHVDAKGRALLTLKLQNPVDRTVHAVTVWIDTAFSGEIVLPRGQVASFGLRVVQAVSAILADGSEAELDTYWGHLDWFGEWRPVEVIANDGQFPLLGVGLLQGRTLHIDYVAGTLSLD